MVPFLETVVGNPSSNHWYRNRPKEAVETARSQVSRLADWAPQGSKMKSIILFSAVLALSFMSPFLVQAEICSLDVTGDAAVTPIDALMIIEKINDRCATSIRMDCLEICCDVDNGGECTTDDADLVMSRFFYPDSEVPLVPFQETYLAKQYHAQQTLIDLVGRMRRYHSESGVFTDSIEALGIEMKEGAFYEYQIHSLKPETGEYRITATSKAPGIAQPGAADDVWTVDQNRRFTHDSVACTGCPQASCLPCYWDNRGVIETLERIADLERDFHSEHNRYSDDFAEIGWLPLATDKYAYTIIADEHTFKVTATSKAPGIMGMGLGDDVWTNDQHDTIINTTNACYCCDAHCSDSQNYILSDIPGHYCNWCFIRQGYAVETLQKIAKFQDAYFAEYNTYTSDMELMAFLLPYYQRYEYTVQANSDSFLARAVVYPEILGEDEWTIDQTGNLVHVKDHCKLCRGMTVQEIHSDAVLCDSLAADTPCRTPNKGLTGQVFVTDTEVILALYLIPFNNVAAFGFDIRYDPTVLGYQSFSPGVMLQSFEKFGKFGFKEFEPGTLRVGGYTLDFIPVDSINLLATISFDILQKAPLNIELLNFTDHMNPWPESSIVIPAPANRNDLAEAIRILKILAGQVIEEDLYAPDVNQNGKRDLAEVIFLLQRVANLRSSGSFCDSQGSY